MAPHHRILIVDDVPAVREALRWVIEDQEDMLVAGEAANGPDALQLAGELQPDAVILDIALPGLDGCAVARRLKASTHPPVVVFLTVHGDAATRWRGSQAGGDAFVTKSSGWRTLLEQIRFLLRQAP